MRRSPPCHSSALALSLSLLGCRGGEPPRVETSQGNADFSPVGVHPGAGEQPTETGRIIATLVAWEGRLYAGYGDINANTGPIDIAPYDPVTGRFVSEWVSDTEAIYTYRAIGGRLYAPAVDPRFRADFAVGVPWRDEQPVHAYHVFDMATLTGSDLWIVGSQGLDAVAWRSSDGGGRWEESVRIRPPSDTGEEFVRFYFAGVYGGRLYLQPRGFRQAPPPASRVFDGRAWSEGPNLLPRPESRGWHPAVFAGRMVYQTAQTVSAEPSQLLAFDGERVTSPLAAPVRDFTADGGVLFVLTADGAVQRTSDLTVWTTVATAPLESRSIGALGGRVYVGTKDSVILRSRRPLY